MKLNGRSVRRVLVLVAAFAVGLCVTCYVLTPGGIRGSVEDGSSENLGKSLVNPKIVVSKDERRLYLHSDSKIVRCYRVGLGFQPVGHKRREGDGRTPEGRYYVCTKNPKSRYYLSLGLSYPNIEDAEHGLQEGVISRRQYEQIVRAIGAGKTPLWNTALGGEIFIHGEGAGSDWTLGCIALDNKDMRGLYEAVEVGTAVTILSTKQGHTASDVFAHAVRVNRPTIVMESSVDSGPWKKDKAIYPLKGQSVALKVDRMAGADIRWFQIIPDISKIYKNANLPWENNPYQWRGLAKIDYQREELTRFRGRWEIHPFENKGKTHGFLNRAREGDRTSRFYREDIGSFWFQAEVAKEGKVYRSAGIEDCDEKGLSPQVLRVSVRDERGYLGYLTSFFNVPGVFGSVTYQSDNYIGVDCADVLMAAYGKWKGKPMEKNYNVAMLVAKWPKVEQFDLSDGRPGKQIGWADGVRPGDLIAVRYDGARQYQHIGALFGDANKNGVLDGEDVVIHAGPEPLHYSYLKAGNFDGHVVILRP